MEFAEFLCNAVFSCNNYSTTEARNLNKIHMNKIKDLRVTCLSSVHFRITVKESMFNKVESTELCIQPFHELNMLYIFVQSHSE